MVRNIVIVLVQFWCAVELADTTVSLLPFDIGRVAVVLTLRMEK
jgi:hypothetical protein